jgi:hypothetical protein
MEPVRLAAAHAATAFDRTVATLADILQAEPPHAGASLTVRFTPQSRPLVVRPLYGPGAIALDPVTRRALYRAGRVVHYYPTPQPHFLVAVETGAPRRRAVGVEVPLTDVTVALGPLSLPHGGRLDLLDRDGDLLWHPERPLSAGEQAQADQLAGHGARLVTLPRETLVYAPILATGVGVLAVLPFQAAPTATPAAVAQAPAATRTMAVAPSQVERARPRESARPQLVAPPTARFALPWPLSRTAIGAIAGAGGLLLFALILWWRGRWSGDPEGGEPDPLEVLVSADPAPPSRLKDLPALRAAVETAEHAIERARGIAAPQRLQEAAPLAQDLCEQAGGLRERLSQASQQAGGVPTEATAWRDAADRVTQLALDLALAATQPDRLEAVLKVVGQLRELALALAQRGETLSAGANSLPYLLELATALHGRCERMENLLSPDQPEDPLDWQLKVAQDALARSSELLAELEGPAEPALTVAHDG